MQSPGSCSLLELQGWCFQRQHIPFQKREALLGGFSVSDRFLPGLGVAGTHGAYLHLSLWI